MNEAEEFLKKVREEIKAENQRVIMLYQTCPLVHYAIDFTRTFDPIFAKLWEQAIKIARGESIAEM